MGIKFRGHFYSRIFNAKLSNEIRYEFKWSLMKFVWYFPLCRQYIDLARAKIENTVLFISMVFHLSL